MKTLDEDIDFAIESSAFDNGDKLIHVRTLRYQLKQLIKEVCEEVIGENYHVTEWDIPHEKISSAYKSYLAGTQINKTRTQQREKLQELLK